MPAPAAAGPEQPSSTPRAGPFIVENLEDLCRLAGAGTSLTDCATLWRMLRDAGRLVLGEDHAVIDVASVDELRAWRVRAQVAARRERSMLGELPWTSSVGPRAEPLAEDEDDDDGVEASG